MNEKKENQLLKLLKEYFVIVMLVVSLIIWFTRLEARINQIEVQQDHMNTVYKVQLSDLKELTQNLAETTQELRITVKELRTELKA